MLRRCIREIAGKYTKTGRSFSWSSGNRSVVYTNKALASASVRRISIEDYRKNTVFEKTVRSFSDAPNLSTKTETMNGSGLRKPLTLDYEGLLKAQEEGEFIIDVREQNEVDETGTLPCSIHIPMGDVADKLQGLSNDEFKKRYKTAKPGKKTKIVLSCRSGMRSGMVQEQLQKLGYEKVYNYTGGWLDWESQHEV